MKILIDVKHPAHVLFFKKFIEIMVKRHQILITSRQKEVTTHLLEVNKIPHIKISSIGNNKLDLIKELIVRNYRFYKIVKEFKPDVLLEVMGVTAAPIGKLLHVPSLVFYDNEKPKLINSIAYRACTEFITPSSFRQNLGPKQKRYNGYKELAYLHPKYFKANPKILDEIGSEKNKKFTIMRFVSKVSSHDISDKGIPLDLKIRAVHEFLKYGKIFITSEKPLPKKLEEFRLGLAPEKIHSLLYYATLLYGESATMASEAAILGTPAIFIDNYGRGSVTDQQRYGLAFTFTESRSDILASIRKGIEILKNEKSKKSAKKMRENMLRDKIDVTDFMIRKVLKFGK